MKRNPQSALSVSTGRDGYGQCADFSGFPAQCDEQADVGPNRPLKSPMSMAAFDDCCGQYRWDTALEDQGGDYAVHCENCPILIERRERVMRAGRAM